MTAALAHAEHLCQRRGARLTPLRRRVLELIWTSHQPRGAYAILEALDHGSDRRTAPLTVYRTLDFLAAHGLIHRIESLNAFIGCALPDHAHSGQFLVCARCGTIIEIDDDGITAAILRSAADAGFEITRPTVEIHGHCHTCRKDAPVTSGAVTSVAQ